MSEAEYRQRLAVLIPDLQGSEKASMRLESSVCKDESALEAMWKRLDTEVRVISKLNRTRSWTHLTMCWFQPAAKRLLRAGRSAVGRRRATMRPNRRSQLFLQWDLRPLPLARLKLRWGQKR